MANDETKGEYLPAEDLDTALALVKHDFDPAAAMALIRHFYACLEEGAPLDEPVLREYLHRAFGLILKGQSPASALGLKRKKGRPKSLEREERDMVLAASVVKLMSQGYTWEDAMGETANRYFPDGNSGDKAVKQAYEDYKDFLRGLSSEAETDALLDAPALPEK